MCYFVVVVFFYKRVICLQAKVKTTRDIIRWGEKTILENIEQRQVDPNVFGCAESSGDVGFPLALHTFIARLF